MDRDNSPELPNNADDMEIGEQENEIAPLPHQDVADPPQNQEERVLKRAGENAESVDEKRKKIEITDFKKYSTLAQELRHHVLSYSYSDTLDEYSLCSKKCHMERKKFVGPSRVELEGVDNSVVVKFVWKATDEVKTKTIINSDEDGLMEDVNHYMLGCYKDFHNAPLEIVIDMKKWPGEIVNMRQIALTDGWHITMRESMYEAFMEFAQLKRCEDPTVDSTKMRLYLTDCDKMEDRVVVGAAFFQYGLIPRLAKLDISTRFSITRHDFIHGDISDLRVTSWQNLEDLQHRVGLADGEDRNIITISLSPDDPLTFKIADLFPRDHFKVRYTNRYTKFKVGRFARGKILRKGKYLKLTTLLENEENHYESDPDETDEDTDGEVDIRTDVENDIFEADDEEEGEADRGGRRRIRRRRRERIRAHREANDEDTDTDN